MEQRITSEELAKKSRAAKDSIKARLRERYAYAKAKGFSAQEAHILSFKSIEDIDRVAQERGM